jgi:hypothetical protein
MQIIIISRSQALDQHGKEKEHQIDNNCCKPLVLANSKTQGCLSRQLTIYYYCEAMLMMTH